MGATPWQGSIAPESRSLAHAGRDGRDRLPVEDHLAHAQAELQGRGRTIEPGQDAGRTGEADWVHDACPPLPADRE